METARRQVGWNKEGVTKFGRPETIFCSGCIDWTKDFLKLDDGCPDHESKELM